MPIVAVTPPLRPLCLVRLRQWLGPGHRLRRCWSYNTLQALDATLAGASLRDVAEGLFGADAAAGWYSDGGLRSKVRRLVRRGDALMRGGYRRLAQLPPLEKGRFEESAKRP